MWFIFLFLQVFVCLNVSWSQTVNTCEIGVLHPHLYISGIPSAGAPITVGHKLSFLCGADHHLNGSMEIECLQNGQWNPSFPTCSGSSGCSIPPQVANGDTVLFTKRDYQEGERVEYSCFPLYTMEGGPFKTCRNGEWVGEMRCLGACIVDEQSMEENNLRFAFSGVKKLYAVHNDHISFYCKRGTRHVGTVPLRVQCIDGVVVLPTCL